MTGPLATSSSSSHPSWWAGTSPSMSGQVRSGQGDGSGQGESLDCKTPPFYCIPLCGHNPRAKYPGNGVSWVPLEHFILGGTERRDWRMV